MRKVVKHVTLYLSSTQFFLISVNNLVVMNNGFPVTGNFSNNMYFRLRWLSLKQIKLICLFSYGKKQKFINSKLSIE